MKIVRNDLVYSKKINDKWVLLEDNKEYIRELNDLASIIWEITKKPTEISVLISRVASFVEKPVLLIQKDITKFINQYIKEGFLVKMD